MNFYDNINNLVASFKKTEEYLEYKKLKEELKTNEDTYKMLKDFKDKQNAKVLSEIESIQENINSTNVLDYIPEEYKEGADKNE